jgi:hypothetical protein
MDWARGIQNVDMSDTGGNVISDSRLIAPAKLARQDYIDVYRQGRDLLVDAEAFRINKLQLLKCDGRNIETCLANYSNYNEGRLFYRFCASYASLTTNGSCRPWLSLTLTEKQNLIPSCDIGQELTCLVEPQDTYQGFDIRNKLAQARQLFGWLAVSDAPVDLTIDGKHIRDLARDHLLTATREIANVHMIFGNEFMVDALDFRFSGNDPRATQIIREEIDQLTKAIQQFKFATDVMVYAFNSDIGGVGDLRAADFFTAKEYDLFITASDRMIVALNELATRYRILGEDQKAVDIYSDAFADQYIQSVAIAQSAGERRETVLANGGWRLINNFEQLRARSRASRETVNPFGFSDKYMPLQDHKKIFDVARTYQRTATSFERDAETWQRSFDQDKKALTDELFAIQDRYTSQMLEICGTQMDYALRCDGSDGLMESNRQAMLIQLDRIRLADQRIANNIQRMIAEEQRAGKVIRIQIDEGNFLAASEYQKGIIDSYRVTKSVVTSETRESVWSKNIGMDFSQVASGAAQGAAGGPVGVLVGALKGLLSGFNAGVSYEYRHSKSKTESLSQVWEPSREEIGEINSLQALQQTAARVGIEGANSEAVIRNLLLDQAELMIQLDIEIGEYNRLSIEHNNLVAKYHYLLEQQKLAQDNLANSYLTNPAYRIIRDSKTIQAAEAIDKAAQYAYLAGRSLEYEMLEPLTDVRMSDIFKARTAADIEVFLNALEGIELNLSGKRSFLYSISVAEHIFGLTDENLDPQRRLTPSQLAQRRFEAFQQMLQQYTVIDGRGRLLAIKIPFSTSLLNSELFGQRIWNNRIAGVGKPLDDSEGVSINIVTRQLDDIGVPQVRLVHSGNATYRTEKGEIVTYIIGDAKPIGHKSRGELINKARYATIESSVNGNDKGRASPELIGLSVAASSWLLEIYLDEPFNKDLKLVELEDIVIKMDTTAISLPGMQLQAEQEAAMFRARNSAP